MLLGARERLEATATCVRSSLVSRFFDELWPYPVTQDATLISAAPAVVLWVKEEHESDRNRSTSSDEEREQ